MPFLLRPHLLAALLGFAAWLVQPAQARVADGNSAEVLEVRGAGEQRPDAQAPWLPARPAQGLRGGAFVRTGEGARMALLFADDTQIRLNQRSVLQIRQVSQQAGEPTTVRLTSGRAWTQTKRAPGQGLQFETPAATAAIRGTDWDIEVDDQGRTVMTVFSGSVEFFNDQGRVTLGRNEAAVAEVGKAPVKLVLTQPQDRVQWVNALTVDVRRYFGAAATGEAHVDAALANGNLEGAARLLRVHLAQLPAPDARWVLLLADVLLAQGEPAAAEAALQEALRQSPGQADLQAQLARVQLLSNRLEASAETLRQADQRPVPSRLVVQGDLARRQGDGAAALQAYARAVQADPAEDRAWFGQGAVLNEREDTEPARLKLEHALRLRPDGPGYRGELGVLETFANRFTEANAAFEQALQQNPSDYVALTGLGLLHLKQGRPEAALDAFLRAGVMEPRYARARTYTAVAYYQLGRHAAAIEALEQAIEMDDKDPVPHMFLAQIHTDLLNPGAAVAAARAAVERLPYLKSVNQLANDQKGSANLGAAMAFFGMEDWALELAHRSATPYWGGSHLFLADRYTGEFNKNSELFQGFLSDPLAFGASPRFSALLRSPGRHGSAEMTWDREDYRLRAPALTLNGMDNSRVPVAYFLRVDRPYGMMPLDLISLKAPTLPDAGSRTDLRGGVSSVGFGLQPTERLGLFAYGNRFRARMNGADPLRTDPEGTALDHVNWQTALGASYRWAPESQSWLKIGRNVTRTRFGALPTLFLEDDVLGLMGLYGDVRKRFDDVQFRHTTDLDARTRLSLGLEHVRESQFGEVLGLGTVFRSIAGRIAPVDELAFVGENRITRRFSALTAQGVHRQGTEWLVDGALTFNRIRDEISGQTAMVLLASGGEVTNPVAHDGSRSALAPRLGAYLRAAPTLSLRAAWQDWVRPLSVSTLNPVDTAGIPMDDVIVAAGGRSRRLAVQAAWTPDSTTFVTGLLERQRIRNPTALGADLRTPSLPFLEDLRASQLPNLSAMDLLEETPAFERGTLTRLTLGASRLWTARLSVYAKVALVRSSSAYDDAAAPGGEMRDRRIPFLPSHTFALGGTWVTATRLYLSARLVHRAERFMDQENLTPLPAGWSTDLVALWESADKHWIFGGGALNLGGDTPLQRTRYVLNARYRF